MGQKEMTVNILPTRTWNRLGMNESQIQIEWPEESVLIKPERLAAGVTWEKEISGKEWDEIQTGMGREYDAMAAECGTAGANRTDTVNGTAVAEENAGAGSIGNYDACSYNLHGEGTFRANAGCNPFCGEIGELHVEKEVRIEMILPAFKKTAVTRALLSVHPYEEPAFDFYSLSNTWEQAGSGVVGELPAEEDELSFLLRIKALFNVGCVKHSPFTGKPIREVAICGGSGAFLIKDAIAYGADVFITGEAKYNDFYDVEDRILLAVIGHYESEICTKDIFYNIISKKFPTFAVHFSNVNSNPVKYL